MNYFLPMEGSRFRHSLLFRFLKIMKLSFFVLLLGMSAVFAESKAQNLTLNLRNVKLEDVFSSVSNQSNYKFFYNDKILKDAPTVSVQLKNASISDVMEQILGDQNLSYKVTADVVTITVDNMTAAPKTVQAQNQVSGTVRDAEGDPIVGASVIVKGSTTGTTTDANGRFNIAAAPTATLVIRFLGYQEREVAVNSRSEISIALQQDDTMIETVEVVATGYQNLDRKLFTGATTKVDAKDAERSGVPDITRMLEGQAAGVSVQNVSGTFGAAPKVRVRGATSLSGENKPLWVVDGIILEDVVNISNEALSTGDANTLIGSSVAGLNPDDIESFTILKDAAATALYGARAMNGVIVVNTKRGRNTGGQPGFSYSSNYTTYLKPTYDQFDIMNSAEQMSVIMESQLKGRYTHSGASRGKDGGVFFKMYNEMYDYDPVTDTYALNNTQEDMLNYLSRYARANTDWFDLLFKNSLLQEHSLSVTSGTEKGQSYFSTSLMKDNGMTIGDNVSRYTANFRNNYNLSEKLTAEFIVNGAIRDQRSPGTLTRQSDPVYGAYSRDFDINPYSYALNTSRMMTAYDEDGELEYFVRNYAPFNILQELETNYLNLNMLDLKVQGGLKYKILPQLTYSVDGAYRYANSTRQHYVLGESNMAEAFRADYDATIASGNINLYTDPDDPSSLPVVVLPEGGFFNTNTNNIKNYYFRQNLEYDDTFAEVHRFNFFGSMELRYTDRQNSNYQGIGYQYANGGLVNPNYRYFKKMIEGGDPYFGMNYNYDRFAAFMGRAAYAFDDRYSLNATMRYDGSNKMGRSSVARWLPTWNVSGAWHLDQEQFFEPILPILSGASVRATYGLTASMGNASSAAVFYNQVTYRPYENEKESGIFLSSLENSELTWEKMYELNIGADLALFNKLDVTFDWYKRDQFDLIGTILTSGIGGQYRKQANYADMKSNGVELTIAGNVFRNTDGFSWRTSFNFGLNENEITNLKSNPNIWNLVRAEGGTLEGGPQRGLYSLAFSRLDGDAGYPLFIGTTGNETPYIRLQDEETKYLTYHGPVDPTFTGGFYNRFSYKNFSLSTLITFATGNMIRKQPAYAATYSDMYTMSKDMINRWMMPGDELITSIPSLIDPLTTSSEVRNEAGSVISAVYPYNSYNYSDQNVAKGDFIRFKNISLAYTLPNDWVSRYKLKNVQLSLVGNNIALFYADRKLNGADPEFFNNGGVAMPIPKQYTFSLKVGF